MSDRDKATHLERALAPVVAPRAGVEKVTITQAGSRKLVRVVIVPDVSGIAPDDHTSTVPPLTMDDIADAARAVSEALDADDSMGQAPYTLEVTSAGATAPVKTWEQYRRSVGRLVTLSCTDGRAPSGRLVAVGPESVTLAQESGQSTYALTDVTGAKVEIEFSRPGDGDDLTADEAEEE